MGNIEDNRIHTCPQPTTNSVTDIIYRVQPSVGGEPVNYPSEEALVDAIIRGSVRPDDKVARVHCEPDGKVVPSGDAKSISETHSALFNPIWSLGGYCAGFGLRLGVAVCLAICAIIMLDALPQGGWGVSYWFGIIAILWAPPQWFKTGGKSAPIVMGTAVLFFRWHGDVAPLPIGHAFDCLPLALWLQLPVSVIGAILGATLATIIGIVWGIIRIKRSNVSPFAKRDDKRAIIAIFVLSALFITELLFFFPLAAKFGNWASGQFSG